MYFTIHCAQCVFLLVMAILWSDLCLIVSASRDAMQKEGVEADTAKTVTKHGNGGLVKDAVLYRSALHKNPTLF